MNATAPLPYRIAVLCYLFDEQGRVLLLHRRKPPNRDLFSPIGGKLEQDMGESPTTCAVREIQEEVGLTVTPAELHLTGIISEAGYGDECHWLMFLYELTHAVRVQRMTFDEGRLEWHAPAAMEALPIPETDRQVIWPLFWRYRGKFFMAHMDCHGGTIRCRVEQPAGDAGVWGRSQETGVRRQESRDSGG
ncbi:MAG: NUDIX domain-containing protein [Phycisphaeraceae bacterium]